MEATAVQSAIQVGRRIRFAAGYRGTDGEGVIVAVRGTPNPAPRAGTLRVIRSNDCTFDAILFDGRRLLGNHECSVNSPGIGIKLLDRVHGPELIEVAKRKAAERVVSEKLAAETAQNTFERAEAARVIAKAPLFYWNGIKDAKGEKLQRCWYSGGELRNHPPGTLTIYARDYARFSELVRDCFLVQNDTDTMTDYFESDRIRVVPGHPLYASVKLALEAQEAHRTKQAQKRGAA